ncbi:hypothetical protein LZ30DRAFT_312460 [Colletotrichum cereale]|nr:hypothetical protein LZ30DRAFT_312460 [Colletotrichum cereale]
MFLFPILRRQKRQHCRRLPTFSLYLRPKLALSVPSSLSQHQLSAAETSTSSTNLNTFHLLSLAMTMTPSCDFFSFPLPGGRDIIILDVSILFSPLVFGNDNESPSWLSLFTITRRQRYLHTRCLITFLTSCPRQFSKDASACGFLSTCLLAGETSSVLIPLNTPHVMFSTIPHR